MLKGNTTGQPTRYQRVYYLYLVVTNAAAEISKRNHRDISKLIDHQYAIRRHHRLPFHPKSEKQMCSEIFSVLMAAVWGRQS